MWKSSILHAETREATIADIRMVLDNIDDLEFEEVCRHTLNKLMKISDEGYAVLDLEVDEGFAYEE